MTTDSTHEALAAEAKQFFNQGFEFYKQRDFQAALTAWQHTIELRKQLPLDNPEYLDALAGAYNNCGLALDNLRRFEEAIVQYQQAIELGKQLPLDNPEYRNNLAGAYNNCGNALDDLRRFEEAIAQYQQAIELGKQLPLDNPQYRNGLAGAYHNCGNALRDLRRFEEAITQYQQAIELGKPLPLDNPEYRNGLASAYHNCGSALYSLGRFAEAEDAVEESLSILRQLEQQGVYWFRELREIAFANAITIYLNGAFNFLPKLILGQLDPVNDGAAPQSERMHQAALKGLRDLLLTRSAKYPQLILEVANTTLKLAAIRAKYFTGTADGAKLTAQFYEENVQDFAKAQNILEYYTQQVENDSEGYIQLADFYVRRQNFQTALNTYQVALQKILLQPLDATQQNSVVAVLQTIYFLIAQPKTWQTEKQVDTSINKIHEWYTDWLLTVSEPLRPTIKLLHTAALQPIDAQRESWREHLKVLQLSEFQKQARQQFEIQLTISFQAIRVLPPTMQTFVATLLNAQRELWQENSPLDDAAMNDKIETLQNTLVAMLQKLPEEELAEAAQLLEQELKTLWAQLMPEEQRFLKLGMRLYQDQIYVFAATSFGCAVETSLKARLFQPVKQFLQQNQIAVTPLNNEDFIAGFFDGKANLMLGNLVGGFNQAFHDGKSVTHQNNVHYLKQRLPHYQPDTDTKQRRGEQLNSLRRIRNQIHTPSAGSPKETEKMLDIIYKNQQDGFYRYLLGA
jgi:tetratricopeptide (TPR) repeat protein